MVTPVAVGGDPTPVEAAVMLGRLGGQAVKVLPPSKEWTEGE